MSLKKSRFIVVDFVVVKITPHFEAAVIPHLSNFPAVAEIFAALLLNHCIWNHSGRLAPPIDGFPGAGMVVQQTAKRRR